MKKGRFLWSAHRITEKQKAGKARNIKEKQLKNSRNQASKPLVAHLSSASAEFPFYQGFPTHGCYGSHGSFLVASAKKKTTSGAGEREKLKIQEAPPLL